MKAKHLFLKLLAGCTLGLAISLISAHSHAENTAAPEQYLRLFLANKPGNPQYEGAKRFADLVAQKTNGRLGIRLYANSAIGNDRDALESMQLGGADLAVMNTNLLVGLIKGAGLIDLPYLFENEQVAYTVLDGPVGKKIHASLEEHGIIGLAYFDMGYYHFMTSARPINKLEDFKGLTLRATETPVAMDTVNALGAKAVGLPFPELYLALMNKKVDGTSQPLINIVSAKFYDSQKYLSLTHQTYTPQSLMINKRIWNTLSPDFQRAIREAANEAKDYQRQFSREKTAQALAALRTKMTVNEPSPEAIENMRQQLKNTLYKKYAKEYGESLANELFAAVEKAKK